MLKASTLSDKQRFYSDQRVKELLRQLLKGDIKLEPSIGANGKIRYEPAEEVLGKEVDAKALINAMAEAGIFTKVPYKDLIMCPVHLRANPWVELECTKCGKRSLKKSSLIEHTSCGYMGDDKNFRLLQCPKCGKQIDSSDELRVTGVWYECNVCANRMSSPKVVLFCKDGPHDFVISEALLEPVYMYELHGGVEKELKIVLVIAPSVGEILSSIGFEVSSPLTVRGQSGADHSVDIYAKRLGTDMVIQIFSGSHPLDPTAVIGFFAKAYDIKAKYAIMVAIPSASDSARKMSSGYGITLIEDSDGSGVAEKVRKAVESGKP